MNPQRLKTTMFSDAMPQIFVFRPTPSWLSLGRYTRSTAADKLNCNCLQGRQLGQRPQKSWLPFLPESDGVAKGAETLFTMGKELKKFPLCNSRRLRKSARYVINCSICLIPVFGLDVEFGGPSQSAIWMFLPGFLVFIVSGD